MPMSIERLSLTVAQSVIRGAAQATGADFGYLLNTAQRESSLAPGARASTSSAAGLFQFIESTWLSVLGRYGDKHGAGQAAADARSLDPQARERALQQRFDPVLSARLAGELANENGAYLEQKLGRAPSQGELYAAHVLGPGGAVKLAQAAARGEGDAAALFPVAARANPALFYSKEHEPVTAAALLSRFGAEFAQEGPAVSQGAINKPAPDTVGFAGAGLAALLVHQWTQAGDDLEPLQRAARAYLENARQSFVNRSGGNSGEGRGPPWE